MRRTHLAAMAVALAFGWGGPAATVAQAQQQPAGVQAEIDGEALAQELQVAAEQLEDLRARLAEAPAEAQVREQVIATITRIDRVLDRLEERPLDPQTMLSVREVRTEMQDVEPLIAGTGAIQEPEALGDALQQVEDRVEPLGGQLTALGPATGEQVEVFGQQVGPAEQQPEPEGDLDIIGGGGAGREEMVEPEPTEDQPGVGAVPLIEEGEPGVAEGFGEGVTDVTEGAQIGQPTGELGIVEDEQQAALGVPFTADELIGTSLYTTEGEQIGEIEDVVFGEEGQVHSVVIDSGGFLGIGGRLVAIDVAEITEGPEGNLVTTMTEEQIGALPEFEAEPADAIAE